jgi:nucleoside-diphosphate-sugar epimerase
MTMLEGKRILVTGVTGQVALPIAAFLAKANTVFGAARFGDAASRERVLAAGIEPCAMDLEQGDLTGLPAEVDHVLHFAFMRGGLGDFDRAMTVNGEGTGLVLQHCAGAGAKAALVISSHAIYAPNPDPYFACPENGELGRSFAPWSPTSPVTKVAEEAVSRFCARAFSLPVTIARLNTVYGSPGNLVSMHIRQMQAGEVVKVPNDPNNHRPIHVEDMCHQVEPLLAAASVPATLVNWAGDEVVSAQQWCRDAAQILGCEARLETFNLPGAQLSHVADVTRRQAITGPCQVAFADGLRRLCAEHHGATL